MNPIRISLLWQDLQQPLDLHHLGGDLNAPRTVSDEVVSAADLVGHLNLIHSRRIQVFGQQEAAYYERLSPTTQAQFHADWQYSEPLALIVAEGLAVPPTLAVVCEQLDIPTFTSSKPAATVIDRLRMYLTKLLAPRIELHGVMMDVLGLGVFITGESGLGKSELALDLITRGHGLVADDMTIFNRIAPEVIEARCPHLLNGFLEVRGLGILDIGAIFGETALRRKMRLRLNVHLQRKTEHDYNGDRLGLNRVSIQILDVAIPQVFIPVDAGRNLAVLLEAAVRNRVLQLRGIDGTLNFVARQRQALESSGQSNLPGFDS